MIIGGKKTKNKRCDRFLMACKQNKKDELPFVRGIHTVSVQGGIVGRSARLKNKEELVNIRLL